LFTERALAAHRVQADPQPLAIDGRTPVPNVASNVSDRVVNARSAKRLMVRNGWCGETRSSRSTKANRLACGFRRLRLLLHIALISPTPNLRNIAPKFSANGVIRVALLQLEDAQ
jgi:hypothetical protein